MGTSSISIVPESDAPRYEILSGLGEGATGAVYLAMDREMGEKVALKKLFRMDQRSVLRFKREFRALADLHHPNLVKLYDLQRASDAWFLTMEFVDGVDLRRELVQADVRATRDESGTSLRAAGLEPQRLARIVHAFLQLASGVHAVHQAGMLHRDLKPSNVLITKAGRVVVLDFGLVRELGQARSEVTLDGTVAGTPAYMPPEQALGRELSEASDWYAFGVMLYEVLSGGSLPIDGRTATQLIQRKLKADPQPLAAELGPRVLLSLCMALLRREAPARPHANEILEVLGRLHGELSGREGSLPLEELTLRHERPEALAARAPLFGRTAELAELHAAFALSLQGQSVAVHVRGASGAGKSSLVEHFLAAVQSRESPALVLRSRCYEREAMPFKALDGAVDALVGHLFPLDDVDVAHLLPAEVSSLTQVFPVFERLRAVQRLLSVGTRQRGDAAQARRRAEQGLRELCTNVARQRALVIWIDDLQWGDLDSLSVIQDWLQRPAEVPVLLLLSYRSEELTTSPCLVPLMAAEADQSAQAFPVPRFELNLAPLGNSDVQELCQQRLGKHAKHSQRAGVSPEPPRAVIQRIVEQARGNPFLALQLTALAQVKLEQGPVDLDALSVEELVLRTSALLTPAARGLLNVLAVAGRPLQPQLALDAADVQRDGRAHLHALQSLRLVRMRHAAGVRLIEVYHDRVREAVQSALTQAESEQIHDRLLRVIEAGGGSDPGWLHDLAIGAGRRRLALRYGVLAADIASAGLAFERAAELYKRCLSLTDATDDRATLWMKLGSVLVRCRRGAAAGQAYLKASEEANDKERVPLLQLAASHLLRSGRFEEGEALVQRVLDALAIVTPKSEAGLYAEIGWEHARIALLERFIAVRAGVPLPQDLVRRGELYGMLALETQFYAPLRAALFQARSMRMSFQFGEATTVARSLCLSATLSCLSGTTAAAERASAQLARAQQLLHDTRDPNVRMEMLSARAVCAMLLGRAADVIEPSYAADEIYETKSSGGEQGDYLYMFAVRTVRIGALQNLGRHLTATAELRELLASAYATDNRTAILQATLVTTVMEQILDRCATSRARLDRERTELPRAGASILHVLHMAAVMRAACVNGEYAWALGVVDEMWASYLRSPVRRSAYLAYLLHSSRSRLKLNQYVSLAANDNGVRSEIDAADLVAEELRWLAKKAPTPYRAPSASRLRGRCAYLRGDHEQAAKHFAASAEEHKQLGAMDDAARERFALGSVLGGAEGERLRREAIVALRDLGVCEPVEDLKGYYPELHPQL